MPGLRLGKNADGTLRVTTPVVDGAPPPPAPADAGAPIAPDAYAGGGTARVDDAPATTTGPTGTRAVDMPRTLGVIDLRDPPAALREDIELFAAAALLSGNSLLGERPGGSPKLTYETWRKALPLLATWPPEVRRSIARLAPLFAKLPDPEERHVEIAALPTWLLANPSVMRALVYLQRDPNDASPHVITDAKLQSAEAERARLPIAVQEGLAHLRGAFLAPPKSDELMCKTTLSSTGARVFSYAGSERAVQLVEQALKQLASSPRFAGVLGKINIILAPPGQPLTYVAGAKGEGASGMAILEGLDGLDDDGDPRRPTLAIDVESVMRSNVVLGHELIHLAELMDPAFMKETDAVFARFIGANADRHPYANAREMLAYLGEWYLVGQGPLLMRDAPDVFALLAKSFGSARVPSRGVDGDMAEASIRHLVDWLRTGTGRGGG